jgi:hypothetical protein
MLQFDTTPRSKGDSFKLVAGSQPTLESHHPESLRAALWDSTSTAQEYHYTVTQFLAFHDAFRIYQKYLSLALLQQLFYRSVCPQVVLAYFCIARWITNVFIAVGY